MKLNGNNIITDNDVTMTGQYIGKTLDTVLNKQEQDISNLKGNVKWLYQNGGVGGKGGGGSQSTKDWSIFATLDGTEINSNSIILDGIGNYVLTVKINNPGGGTFLCNVQYTNKQGKQQLQSVYLTMDNTYKTSYTLQLNTNDSVIVTVMDENTTTKQVSANYITTAYDFYIQYVKNNGDIYQNSTNDIFVEDIQKQGLHLLINYSISIDSTVKYKYTKFDGTETEFTNLDFNIGSGKSELLDLADASFYTNEKSGYYSTVCTIEITPKNQKPIIIEKVLSCNLIPNSLYLKIAPTTGIIYDNSNVQSPQSFSPGNIKFNIQVYNGANLNRNYTVFTKLNGNLYGDSNGISITERKQTPIIIQASKDGWNTLEFTINDYHITKYFYIKNTNVDLTYDRIFNTNTIKRIYHWDIEHNTAECTKVFKANPYLKFTKTSSQQEITWKLDTNETVTSFVCNISLELSYLVDQKLPIFTIRDSTGLSTNDSSNYIYIYQDKIKIGNIEVECFIPTNETTLGNYNDNYHLLTIFKNFTKKLEDNNYCYEYLFYVDGKLEATFITQINPTYSSILFNNQEYNCNLVDFVQYTITDKSYLPKDQDICKYYYIYLNSQGKNNLISSFNDYIEVSKYLQNIKLNSGENNKMVEIPENDVLNLAQNIDTPVILLDIENITSYKNASDKSIENFLRWYCATYQQEEETGSMEVKVYYSNKKSGLKKVTLDDNDSIYTFFIELQGSSTKSRFCKNLELGIKSRNDDSKTYIYTPNFISEGTSGYTNSEIHNTFLPEKSFTLKADEVDSSHCNNNSIGAFINDNTVKFDTGVTGKYKSYVKNCLIGFPCLIFVRTNYTDKVTNIHDTHTYYLGIYNFNLGRESYFNLGYINSSKLDDLRLKSGFNIYEISTDDYVKMEGLRVAEIQDNDPYYDFSQYDATIVDHLGKLDETSTMFGDFVYGGQRTTLSSVKEDVRTLVQHVALAGGYIFDYLKKNFGKNEDKYSASLYNYTKNLSDRYYSINQVPDYRNQYEKYLTDNNLIGYRVKTTIPNATKQDLTSCVMGDLDTNTVAYINYQSLVEYYTICMAFSMLDSVEKNLNIKSWNGGKQWYIAFYDMDTANGKDNAGAKVGYYAFSDYWIINSGSNNLSNAIIQRDFAPNVDTTTKFYDIPSSYLLAIAKYTGMVLGEDLSNTNLDRIFPLKLWAQWRKADGPLASAETFMKKYFTGRFENIGPELLNLDYRAKYLVHASDTSYINDIAQFNGSGQYSVQDWLNQRLHILDVYMGLSSTTPTQRPVQYFDLSTRTWNTLKYNSIITEKELISSEFPTDNPDIEIYTDIFSDNNSSTNNRIPYSNDINITIKTLPKSFIVISRSDSVHRYYIEDSNTLYNLQETFTGAQVAIFGGSNRWTYISNLTSFYLRDLSKNPMYLKSLNLQNFYFDNAQLSGDIGANIYLPQCTDIKFTNGSNVEATFTINKSNFPVLKTADFSTTKAQIFIDSVPLDTFIARDVNAPTKNLVLQNCNISQLDISNSKFNAVTINPLIGILNLTNLQCNTLYIRGNGQSITIQNNSLLKEVTLSNFSSVVIDNCKNLTTINITDNTITNLSVTNCSGISKSLKVGSLAKNIDLSKFTNLKTVSFNNTIGFNSVRFNNGCTLTSDAFRNTEIETITGGMAYINGTNIFKNTPLTSGLKYLYVTNSCTDITGTFDIGSYRQIEAGTTKLKKINLQEVLNFLNNIPSSNNITNTSYLFCGQYGIEYINGIQEYNNQTCSIQLSKFSKVTNITGMFCFTHIDFLNKYMFKDIGKSVGNIVMTSVLGDNSEITTTIDGLQYILPKTQKIDIIQTYWYWGRPIKFINTNSELIINPKVSDFFNNGNLYNSSNIIELNGVNIYTYKKKTVYDTLQEVLPQYENLFNNSNWNNLRVINGYSFDNIYMQDFAQMGLQNLQLTNVSMSFQNVQSEKVINYGTIINWTNLLKYENPIYFLNNTIKYINDSDFQNIWLAISKNPRITSVEGLFRNTYLINSNKTNYINTVLSNITSISDTFYQFHLLSSISGIITTTQLSQQETLPLYIDKQFLKAFPKCTVFNRAFCNTYIQDLPEFDFFKKRQESKTQVYQKSSDGTNSQKQIYLVTYNYNTNISEISGIFAGTKFKNNTFFTSDYTKVNNYTLQKGNYYIYDNHLEDTSGKVLSDTEYYKQLSSQKVTKVTPDPYFTDIANPTTCHYSTAMENITDNNFTVGDNVGKYILPPDFFAPITNNIKEAVASSNIFGSLPSSLMYSIVSQNTQDLFGSVNVLPTYYGEFKYVVKQNPNITTKRVYSFIPKNFCRFTKSFEGMFGFQPRFSGSKITKNTNLNIINYYYVFLDISFVTIPNSLNNVMLTQRHEFTNDGTNPLNVMFNTKLVTESEGNKVCGEDGWSIIDSNFYCDGLFTSNYLNNSCGNLFAYYNSKPINNWYMNTLPIISISSKLVGAGNKFPQAIGNLNKIVDINSEVSYTIYGIPTVGSQYYQNILPNTNVTLSTELKVIE